MRDVGIGAVKMWNAVAHPAQALIEYVRVLLRKLRPRVLRTPRLYALMACSGRAQSRTSAGARCRAMP